MLLNIAANGLVYRQVARNYGCGFVGLTVLFVMETNLVLFYETRHLRYTLLPTVILVQIMIDNYKFLSFKSNKSL